MPQIIKYVDDLVAKGAAYTSDGDVYLRVRNIPNYGELSGNSVEDLESGSRIAVGEKKEDPLDFALWKKTDVGIKWPTKWSEGRPGWHTECCVMAIWMGFIRRQRRTPRVINSFLYRER